MDLADLSEPFPQDAVHWRAQTLTKSGDKALALAYLDARDVQDRLDEVCGPENWQCEYHETPKGRMICRIGILINGEWVWKSDGSGDTDIEGEKGGISSAFKRAAVPWGVGRYLYRLKSPWVPCESGEWNGKKQWRKWTADPWDYVRGDTPAPKHHKEPEPFDAPATRDRIKAAIAKAGDAQSLDAFWNHDAVREAFPKLPAPMQGELQKCFSDRMAAVAQAPVREAAE